MKEKEHSFLHEPGACAVGQDFEVMEVAENSTLIQLNKVEMVNIAMDQLEEAKKKQRRTLTEL